MEDFPWERYNPAPGSRVTRRSMLSGVYRQRHLGSGTAAGMRAAEPIQTSIVSPDRYFELEKEPIYGSEAKLNWTVLMS